MTMAKFVTISGLTVYIVLKQFIYIEYRKSSQINSLRVKTYFFRENVHNLWIFHTSLIQTKNVQFRLRSWSKASPVQSKP